MKKLHAFTMMELLVTIVISSIVVSTALAVFVHINTYFSNNNNQQEEINKIISLQSLLNYDVEKAREIYCLSDRVLLTNSESLICYKFLDSYIIREHKANSDTFTLVSTDLSSEKLDNYCDLIKEVSFNIETQHKQWFFRFYKQYPRSVLFNLSTAEK